MVALLLWNNPINTETNWLVSFFLWSVPFFYFSLPSFLSSFLPEKGQVWMNERGEELKHVGIYRSVSCSKYAKRRWEGGHERKSRRAVNSATHGVEKLLGAAWVRGLTWLHINYEAAVWVSESEGELKKKKKKTQRWILVKIREKRVGVQAHGGATPELQALTHTHRHTQTHTGVHRHTHTHVQTDKHPGGVHSGKTDASTCGNVCGQQPRPLYRMSVGWWEA